jgi:hypothetical protein
LWKIPHFHRLLSIETGAQPISFYFSVRSRVEHPQPTTCPLHLGLVLSLHEGNMKVGKAELSHAFIVTHGYFRIIKAAVG